MWFEFKKMLDWQIKKSRSEVGLCTRQPMYLLLEFVARYCRGQLSPEGYMIHTCFWWGGFGVFRARWRWGCYIFQVKPENLINKNMVTCAFSNNTMGGKLTWFMVWHFYYFQKWFLREKQICDMNNYSACVDMAHWWIHTQHKLHAHHLTLHHSVACIALVFQSVMFMYIILKLFSSSTW